jgi:HAD superfamily hydrolase (TIGR01549 family)
MNILWDFDGTLFDTYPAYTENLYKVLNGTVVREDIYRELKISATHAFKHFKLSDEQIKEVKKLNLEIPPSSIKPFPNVEKILRFANKNVIMTHKERKPVLDILQYYGFEKYFIEIITIDNGYPRKPDPTSYQYLHDKYDLDLAIGDRELDLIPAKKIGMMSCMYGGNCEAADFQINDYNDFFKVVKLNN